MPITPNDPADFTPTMKGYSGQGAFRFWCQTVLPLVYDDSLSYYELLNKVVVYLNNTISDVANMEDNVGGLHDAYVELQGYVNDYFSTLDVQEEINNKLDIMAVDGTLTALINPLIPPAVSSWLGEHLTPTEPPVDDSLSIANAAADSKTVGDLFKKTLLTRATLTSEDDLNNIELQGIYFYGTYTGSGGAPAHAPEAQGQRFRVLIIKGDSSHSAEWQVIIDNNNNYYYRNYKHNVGFNDWEIAINETTLAKKLERALVTRTTLSESDDLNTLELPGVYYFSDVDDNTLPAHMPETTSHRFRLLVIKSDTASSHNAEWQIMIDENDVFHYRSFMYGAGFNSWRKVVSENALTTILTRALMTRTTLYSTDDLNALEMQGIYYFADEAPTWTLPQNAPPSTGTRFRMIDVKSDTANNHGGEYQLVVDDKNKYFYRSYNIDNSSWNNWQVIANDSDVQRLNKAAYQVIDDEAFGYWCGAIGTDGSQTDSQGNATKRLVITDASGATGFFAGEGSTIVAAEGYKFNVAMYSRYVSPTNYTMVDLRSMGTDPFTVPHDYYIKISYGAVNNDVLWTNEDEGKELTSAGEAALGKLTLNILGKSAIQLINDINNRDYSNEVVRELTHTIPQTAVGYHAMWDGFLKANYFTRTGPTYIERSAYGDYTKWPLYYYEITAGKNWMGSFNDGLPTGSSYDAHIYNGTTEYPNHVVELYPRPKILLTSGVHGSEKGTPSFLYEFVKQLITNPKYGDILNAFDWTIIPIVNPWGYSHSTTKGTGLYYGTGWAPNNIVENTPTNGYIGGVRRNAEGYDINRDFSDNTYVAENDGADAAYDATVGSNRTYGFQTFEAEYVADIMRSKKFDVCIDLHQARTSGRGTTVNNQRCAFVCSAYNSSFVNDSNHRYSIVAKSAGICDRAMLDYYPGSSAKQFAFPWGGINSPTVKGYAGGISYSSGGITLGNTKNSDWQATYGTTGDINYAQVIETCPWCGPFSGVAGSAYTYNKQANTYGNTFVNTYLETLFRDVANSLS